MEKYFDINCMLVLLIISTASLANCVPTSVLANSKALSDNIKVKRASPSLPNSDAPGALMEKGSLPPNGDVEIKQPPQKRGAGPQYFNRGEGVVPIGADLSSDLYVNNFPNGIFDDADAEPLYRGMPDVEDYQPGPLAYRQRPYDNLQNVLNSNVFEEPLALPIQYNPYQRYYPDRQKRSSFRKLGLRLKRESQLSPADMLTLIALAEAGERQRYADGENSLENPIDYPPKSLLSPYEYSTQQDDIDGGEWWNALAEPSVQYYGPPPAYSHLDIPHYQNLYPAKRYVMKNKRSLSSPHIPAGFDTRLLNHQDIQENGSRKHHATKYF